MFDMQFEALRLDIAENVALIRLDRPPVNALDATFLDEFETSLDAVSKPGAARALVIQSAVPGFFSAGDDVDGLRDTTRELGSETIDLLGRAHAGLDRLERLPLPTVASISGHALGGGLELALACDFRFMGDGAGRIGLPEVRLGMIPALGGTQRLPQIVGKAKALEMMIKGLQLAPEDAEQVGLVNAVYPQDEIDDRSYDYARRLARQATGAIAHVKECVRVGFADGRAAGMEAERAAFAANITSADAREGVEAFLSGRAPVFRG